MNAYQLIAKHEGYRRFMYKCTNGRNTIGYGFNLDAGISRDVAAQLLLYQAEEATYGATRDFPWYRGLDEVRQAVVINMIFNLGLKGFKNFIKTRAYIADGEYELAATEMLDSRWARQVGDRATELSEMMRTGQWPE